MPKLVLKNPVITIATIDLSDHIASVTLTTTVDEVETTAFGDNARTRVGGLEDSSVTLSFHEDFASAEVHQTIYPLIGSSAAITIKPVSTTTSSSNPVFGFSALVTEWPLLNGAVGELATAEITWPVSGVITKSTS
jgi:hypothetical protein